MSYDPYSTDAQYRAPTEAPPSGGIEWLPNLPFAGNGARVCNEASPSWEEVITMVVIPGHPEMVREASGAWEVVFSRVEQARSLVDQVNRNVASWQGAAGEAYKAHLTQLSEGMSHLVEQHRPVVQQLNSAADNLQTALENTPIPDDMVDDVMAARANFGDSGNLNVYRPGLFYDILFPIFSNRWLSELGSFLTFGFTDWASRKLRNWLTDNDEKAVAAYRALGGQHVSTMDGMPPTQSLLPIAEETATVNPTMPPGGRMPSTAPGAGSIGNVGAPGGGPGVDPNSWANDPGGFNTSLAGAGSGISGAGGAGAGGLGGLSPGSASLAGAGGAGGASLASGSMPGAGSAAGAIARGGGMGGMGMGMGGGLAGAGGAGARGAGARGAGGGGARGVGAGGAGRGMGGMPMGGMGAGAAGARSGGAKGGGPGRVAGGAAGAGAGAAGAGRGAGAGRAGMAPMGAGGAGAGGDATDHSTWLEEDEDVWGVDSDAAPPVLG